ncbi:hypothetical protein EDC04DRAFT_3000549, partial [Pisolithus marmoratus]
VTTRFWARQLGGGKQSLYWALKGGEGLRVHYKMQHCDSSLFGSMLMYMRWDECILHNIKEGVMSESMSWLGDGSGDGHADMLLSIVPWKQMSGANMAGAGASLDEAADFHALEPGWYGHINTQKCAGKMGDGAFKPAIMNAATVHLLQLFPNQRGLMKTGEHCKRQMSSICVYPDHLITDQLIVVIQLKTILRDINQWHSTSGQKLGWRRNKSSKPGCRIALQIPCAISKTVGGPTLKAITISDSTECGGVSAGSHVSSISGTPSSHICPSYPNSSSHALSDLIMTPSISSVPFRLIAPWVSSPSGTVVGGTSNDGFVKKPLNFIDIGPQALPLPHPLIPPPASPAVFSSSAPPMTTAQAALQAISVEDDGEWSLKRVRKGKDQSTQVALASMQGLLSYLGSVILSLSPAAAQQIWTDKLQVALMMVEEQDKDLPIEAKAALIEAFRVDGSPQMLDAMLSLLPQTCTQELHAVAHVL